MSERRYRYFGVLLEVQERWKESRLNHGIGKRYSTSYHDLKDENSYHMMMLGICTFFSGQYEIAGNREWGHGRSDILLRARKEGRSHIKFAKRTCGASHILSVMAELLRTVTHIKSITKKTIDNCMMRCYE